VILTRLAAATLAAVSLVGFSTRQAGSQATSSDDAQSSSGAQVFAHSCLSCHDGNDARAPGLAAMRGRAPQAIVDALTAGSMRYQGLALSGDERRAVAEYITGRPLRGTVSGATLGRCAARPALAESAARPQWNGWGPTIANTHAQAAAQAGVTAEQVPALELKWAFGFPDATSAWAQPTIAGGRLFVGSQNGTVYSLDARTGCIIWTFAAHGGVRASVSIGPRGAARTPSYAAYFSDQNGYAYAVDASTGSLLWSRKVDEHPLVRLTGSPTLYDGRLYVPTSSYEEGGKPPGYACCTFRGSLVALDAPTGDEVWKAYTIPERPTLIREYAGGTQIWAPSGGAIWSAPTIDVKRGAIYVGVGNTYSGKAQPTTDAIVALDLKTGALRWARQMMPGERDVFGCTPGELNCGLKAGPDFDFGASPVLVTSPSGHDLIVAGQKSGVAYALDPDRKGQQVWRYRAGGGSGLGGIQWGLAADGTQAYFPIADIYSDMPGGMHAVSLATGKRAWFTPPPPPACGRPGRACSGAQFSAVTVIPGVVFSPSNDGAVRAYSTKDGAIIWTYDANHEFKTLNGVRAKGGSMNGPAPVVAGGMVYVSSGYGAFGLRPGNVLLAFGVP
jgi:polyvinyl alcohol dehydrogenase (cytochrome)